MPSSVPLSVGFCKASHFCPFFVPFVTAFLAEAEQVWGRECSRRLCGMCSAFCGQADLGGAEAGAVGDTVRVWDVYFFDWPSLVSGTLRRRDVPDGSGRLNGELNAETGREVAEM